MADTIDPALADQQDQQQQANPDIESLVNMDTETAKQMADSVYHAAPVASLVSTTPAQVEREGKARTMWGKWVSLLQKQGGITGKIASYIDPVARGALKGVSETARTVQSANEFAQKHGAHTGVLGAALNVADLASKKIASALGDEEYRGIAHDGLILSRKAQDLMGPDENEGLRGFVEGVAQFATVNAMIPEIGAGKMVAGAVEKLPKVAKYAGKIGKVASTMGKGAVVDATGFDPHAERFSQFFINAPLGIGEAAQWLAGNPDDSDAEGRFKAALEGIVVGSAFDFAVHAVKAGGKATARGVGKLFTPETAGAPKMADFAASRQPLGDGTLLEPGSGDFAAVPTESGKFTVEPTNLASMDIPSADLPKFDTLAEAQGAAAQFSYASRNARRPRIEVSPQQSEFLRAYAGWVRDTGKFGELEAGTLEGSTGALHGGAPDINFRYDLNAGETEAMIRSMSVVLRSELEGVKVPESMMHDPNGGAHISHAETLAGTVKAHDGTTAGALTDSMEGLNEAVTQARYSLLASRMLRQNLSAQAEQLARQLEMPGATHVAHDEFTKAANTLVNLFAQESALAGNIARTLESRKIKGGFFGALVNKKALGRSLGMKRVDPLDVIKFNMLDESAVSPEEVAKIEQAASKRRKPSKLPKRDGADVSGMEVPMGENPSGTAHVGTNTYTLIDEAQTRIDAALKKLDEADVAPAEKPPTDAQVSKAVSKDKGRMDQAFEQNGVTLEDRELAKARLEAMKQTLAEKKKAGGKIINLSSLDEGELADVASMHAERIKKLADAQRESPMVPKKQTDVYLTRRQLRAMARQMTYVPRDEKERAKVLETIIGISKEATEQGGADVKPSTWEKIVSYRAAAMLSSPKTGVVNFFSAISQSYYRPLESFLGALANGKDREGMDLAHDLLIGTMKAHHDAWKMAKESFSKGESILAARDPSMPRPDIWSESWKPVRMFMNALGTTGRFMTSGDEFAQQLSYRGHVYAQSMRNARKAGLSGEQLAQALEDDMQQAFSKHGQGVNPAALTYAQDVTLRRPLEGGIGKMIEDGARENPVMRILFPFVRIPVNLVRYQMDRAPVLGALTKRNREDWMAGGMQRNEMIGRQVAGVMFWGSGLAMADAGIITGGGPSDPELRRTWLNVNQPYSVKLPGTDTWISYRRFEPLSTAFGIMADFHQMIGELDEDGSDKDTGQIINAFLAGVGQNLLSKTYLKSVSDLFYALGSGKPSAMQNFMAGTIGSFIPNAISSAEWDDSLRETRSLLDQLKTRVPGLSSTLEPRRNIYGEKVMKPAGMFQRAFNPYTVRSDTADDVDHELLRLGEQMSMPLSKKFGVELADRSLGVDGKQSPYDRWMELMSEPQEGKSLRTALHDLVTSDRYKKLSDSVNGYQGTKSLAVEAVVRGYRAKAFAKMLRENPKVMQEMRTKAGERAAVLSADPDMAEALTGSVSTPAQLKGLAADATNFLQ